ncbi:hypothetical protein CJF30_00010179 [Rutstroemia sp. NJR-2017a BBW]|nr:hypothetical protein CJF30_00010179 [Rutstroemia sp. NJR-2017a BBW]
MVRRIRTDSIGEENPNTAKSTSSTAAMGEKRGGKRTRNAEENSVVEKRHRADKDQNSQPSTNIESATGDSGTNTNKPRDSTTTPRVGNTTSNIGAVPAAPQPVPSTRSYQENSIARGAQLRSVEIGLQRQIERMRTQWQLEVEAFDRKEKELQATIDDLRSQKQHLNAARLAREEGRNEPIEERTFQYCEEIYRLMKENKEVRRLTDLTELNSSNYRHLAVDDVDEAMDQIQFELSSIAYHRPADQPFLLRHGTVSEDLSTLVQSVVGLNIREPLDNQRLEIVMSRYGTHVCLRSFVLAALRDWVFMSNFPSFAPLDSRLLSTYRDILRTTDKPDRLYTLDLAAHRILIGRKCFKEELIRRKAAQLACKFSTALAPLFSLPLKESVGLPFHTWDESVEVWKDRRSHIHEIFQIALNLKAESVVTESQYEFAVYHLGRTHCEDVDNKNSWILASFHIYDRPASGDHDVEHAGLVQTKNFVSRTEGERVGAKHSKIMLFSRRNARPVSSRISAPQKRPNPGCNGQGAVIETTRPSTGMNGQKGSAETASVSRKANEAGCAAEEDRVREAVNISAPACGEYGEVFQNMLLFHQHRNTRICCKCPECGRKFSRRQIMQKHYSAEHVEYVPAR